MDKEKKWTYKWGRYFGYKRIKALLLFYFGLMISLGIILPIVARQEFNKINFNFLDKGNTPLIFAIIVMSEIFIYATIKRSGSIIKLFKSKKINDFFEKNKKKFNIVRWLLLYFHLAFTPIMITLVSWHATTGLQFVIEYNAFKKMINISGLLFWIAALCLFTTGVLMAVVYGWSRKYKILWIHIFSALIFLLGLVLHLTS